MSSNLSSAPLRLVSYNILADCYVRVPGQPWNAFAHCSEEHLSFSQRCPRIIAQLVQSEADVIALQEVTFELREGVWGLPEYLVSALEAHGYVAVMQGLKQKELAKNALRNEANVGKACPTGLAMFWRNEKFIEFDASKSSSGSGMTVFLQFRESNSLLCVNNIHLVGSPSKFDHHINQLNGALKQLNNKKVLDAIKCGSVKCVYEFIVGDFNGDLSTVCDSKIDGVDDTENLRTAVGEWFHERHFQRAATGASWASDSLCSTLDHVMFRCQLAQEGANPSTVRLVCLECQPEQKQCVEKDVSLVGGLPNGCHPSDHVMLQVDFVCVAE